MMMLWLTCIVLLTAFSFGERPAKQPRHSTRSASAVDLHRRSTRASNQATPVADAAVIPEKPLESDSTGYDLWDMQSIAESLLRSLEDIRSQIYDEHPLHESSDERNWLLNAVEANMAVVSLALEDITRLLGSQETSEIYTNAVEDRQLKDLNSLLDAGENEKMKLRARLMQFKQKWVPLSTEDWDPIDIKPSITGEEEGRLGVHLRRLIPESLEQQLHDYDDQSVVVLPPSHIGSGLLSDTGHEDVTLPLENEEGQQQSTTKKDQTFSLERSIQEDPSNHREQIVGQEQQVESEEHSFISQQSTGRNTTSGNATSGSTTSGNTTSGNATSGNTTLGSETLGSETSGSSSNLHSISALGFFVAVFIFLF